MSPWGWGGRAHARLFPSCSPDQGQLLHRVGASRAHPKERRAHPPTQTPSRGLSDLQGLLRCPHAPQESRGVTDPLRGQCLESFLVVTMQKGTGVPGMLLNILRCPGQPPKQNHPAQTSAVPRRRKPAGGAFTQAAVEHLLHTNPRRRRGRGAPCHTAIAGTRTRLQLTQRPTAEPPYILPGPRGL